MCRCVGAKWFSKHANNATAHVVCKPNNPLALTEGTDWQAVASRNYLEDVLEVRIAEVGDNLGVGSCYSSRQAEGVHRPFQVAAPPVLLQW